MSNRRVLSLGLVIAAFSLQPGCSTSGQQAHDPVQQRPEPVVTEPGKAESKMTKEPTGAPSRGGEGADRAARAEGEGDADKTVRYTARLDMDRLSGGKRLQATVLHLDDGRRLLASYRAVEAYFQYVDKRVVVEGQHYTNPPEVQSVQADHFRITSIALAPGETPYATPPTQLPTPPTVKTRAELEARDGRWVQIFARLKTGSKHTDDDWCDAVATLDDGTEVWASMYKTTFNEVWKPLFGKRVTLIGRAFVDAKDPRQRFKLQSQVAICPGKVERCGMDEDVHSRNRGSLTPGKPIKIR